MLIKGVVIKGDELARKLNYPTANLDIDFESLDLKSGIYAGRVKLEDVKYNAGIIIKDQEKKFEAHLFDYSGDDFYNKEMEVLFMEKIGEVSVLKGQSLQKKIDEDAKKIKNILDIN